MSSATSMYPLSVSIAEYTNGQFDVQIAHKLCLGLNEVLDKAAFLSTEPIPLACGEMPFSSALAVQDESGRIVGVWHSEPMFSSVEAALDHANDLLGCELFPLICGSSWE